MKNKIKTEKYLFIAVILLTMIFIWSNSFKNGSASMNESNSVKEWILSLFSSFGIDIKNSFFIEFIRKFGHFSEFFILGLELIIFGRKYLKKSFSNILNVFYIGFFCAFADETIQCIPSLSRSAEITDVWIDVFGVLSGFLLYFVVRAVYVKLFKKQT